MKRIYPLFLVLLAAGCASGDARLKEALQGDWEWVSGCNAGFDWQYPPEIKRGWGAGWHLAFHQDSAYWLHGVRGYQRVENPGFFERTFRPIFYGNASLFHLRNDSVWITNPVTDTWVPFGRVEEVSQDSLWLTFGDTCTVVYARMREAPLATAPFDRIVVGSSGCFGSCPIGSFSFDQTGRFLYQGEENVDSIGLFEGRLQPWQVQAQWMFFQQFPFDSLKNQYKASHTDSETITVTFLKGDSIVKTVSDYGHAGPPAFVSACRGARLMSETIPLQRIPVPQNLRPGL